MLTVDWMTLTLAFFAALAAGAVNSIAGGGTLLTFPLLMALGLDGKTANATSTIGLWAGSLAGALGFREELAHGDTRIVLPFFGASVVGGVIGSTLLLYTRPAFFDDIVPWLILSATLLFASQTAIRRWLRTHPHDHILTTRLPVVVAVQLAVGIYGGYFGAGMGILMLAVLGFLGMSNIHQMNGIKNMAATAINGVTILIFIGASLTSDMLKINWPIAAAMVLGAVVGGYGCAGLSKRLNPMYIRRAVVVIGLVGAAWTAYKTWFATP